MKYNIVISRYNEDLTWINNYEFIHKNAVIYNKGNSIEGKIASKQIHNISNVPKFAREADCMLTYIIEYYDNLPEYIYFIQADPFDHCFYFIDVLKYLIDSESNKDYQPLTFGWKISESIPPLNHILYDTREYVNDFKINMQYANENLHPIGYRDNGLLDIIKNFRLHHKLTEKDKILPYLYHRLKFNKKNYAGFIKYNYGAMFGVKKKNILSNSKAYYEELKNFNLEHFTHVFILERLWYTIFTQSLYI